MHACSGLAPRVCTLVHFYIKGSLCWNIQPAACLVAECFLLIFTVFEAFCVSFVQITQTGRAFFWSFYAMTLGQLSLMLLLAVLYANGGGVHMSRGSPRVSPIVVSQARNATKNGFTIYDICLGVSWGG